VLLVQAGRLPTTDYLVLPHVAGLGVPVRVADSARERSDDGALAPGALVVFVRYVERAWMARVEAALPRLAGVAYFMDDDLLDAAALRGLPPRYAWKILRLALARRNWLRRVGARLWVSTAYLADKYRTWAPVVIAPRPDAALLARSSPVRVFYHGTASHGAEIRWLVPVVREVLGRAPESSFEIFGDVSVNRLYRGLPRVSVLHPMSWTNYLAYTSSAPLDIGLAPLLPGRFNAARVHTKFFDFVRCGAAGIYSDVEPYASFVRDGVDGMLVPNEPGAWREAILRLIADGDFRARMTAAARERALALAAGTAG
jgi:glycosyltransferase involved in cell wall biosynthesis